MDAEFKQEKTNFLPGIQFEYALGKTVIVKNQKRHADFSAKNYDDSADPNKTQNMCLCISGCKS